VAPDEEPIEAGLILLDREELAHADPGGEAVHLLASRQGGVHDIARGAHALDRAGVELDALPLTCDPNDVDERERRPREDDRHPQSGASEQASSICATLCPSEWLQETR
jgi:hypothetical protein